MTVLRSDFKITKFREKAKTVYTEINNAKNDSESLSNQMKKNVDYIPTFGDNYDSLGNNVRVNIESFAKTLKEFNDELGEINRGSETTTEYYGYAKKEDKKLEFVEYEKALKKEQSPGSTGQTI